MAAVSCKRGPHLWLPPRPRRLWGCVSRFSDVDVFDSFLVCSSKMYLNVYVSCPAYISQILLLDLRIGQFLWRITVEEWRHCNHSCQEHPCSGMAVTPGLQTDISFWFASLKVIYIYMYVAIGSRREAKQIPGVCFLLLGHWKFAWMAEWERQSEREIAYLVTVIFSRPDRAPMSHSFHVIVFKCSVDL